MTTHGYIIATFLILCLFAFVAGAAEGWVSR